MTTLARPAPLLRRAADAWSFVRATADCGGPDADAAAGPPGPGRYLDLAYPLDETSPDQLAIEAALRPLAAPGRRWLHVGIGGSGLARRFAGTGVLLDGITVDPRELAFAAGLGIPDYRVWHCDKHTPSAAALPGRYDVVVDNNLASYACCRRHFRAWLGVIATLLAPGGALYTAARGLGYCEPSGFRIPPSWLYREARRVGLVPTARGEGVLVYGREWRSA